MDHLPLDPSRVPKGRSRRRRDDRRRRRSWGLRRLRAPLLLEMQSRMLHHEARPDVRGHPHHEGVVVGNIILFIGREPSGAGSQPAAAAAAAAARGVGGVSGGAKGDGLAGEGVTCRVQHELVALGLRVRRGELLRLRSFGCRRRRRRSRLLLLLLLALVLGRALLLLLERLLRSLPRGTDKAGSEGSCSSSSPSSAAPLAQRPQPRRRRLQLGPQRPQVQRVDDGSAALHQLRADVDHVDGPPKGRGAEEQEVGAATRGTGGGARARGRAGGARRSVLLQLVLMLTLLLLLLLLLFKARVLLVLVLLVASPSSGAPPVRRRQTPAPGVEMVRPAAARRDGERGRARKPPRRDRRPRGPRRCRRGRRSGDVPEGVAPLRGRGGRRGRGRRRAVARGPRAAE